jgi:hypothetical protein
MQPEQFNDYAPGMDESKKIFTVYGLERSKCVTKLFFSSILGNIKLRNTGTNCNMWMDKK